MTRRFPLLLTGPVASAATDAAPATPVSGILSQREAASSGESAPSPVRSVQDVPAAIPDRSVWERLASQPADRAIQAAFRPEFAAIGAGIARLSLPAPVDLEKLRWHAREGVALGVKTRIGTFLSSSGESLRGEETALFFWDLGKFIGESRREFSGATDDVFNSWLSERVLAACSDELAMIGERGFNVETWLSPSHFADIQRLARVFPRDYLGRFTKALSVRPGDVWAYVREIMALPDPYERVYYAEMASRFVWKLETLRRNVKMQRFQTCTVARQSDERLRKALIDMSKGDLSEWIYRDLLRFDFLNGGNEFRDKKEPDFQKFMMERMDRITEEFGEGFTFVENQAVRYYEDADGRRSNIRMDVLAQVNDGRETYPLVIELKKGDFDDAVHEQCKLYRSVIRGKDDEGRRIEPGGYLKPNESKVVVMALVTDFDRGFEKVMEVGLRKNGRRSDIFVTLYTFKKPPQEFLDRAIGAQLRLSSARAARDEERLREQGAVFVAGSDFGEAEGLFLAIMSPAEVVKDPQTPF